MRRNFHWNTSGTAWKLTEANGCSQIQQHNRRVIRSKHMDSTMRYFLACGSTLRQNDCARTKNFFKFIFQSKVTEVCLDIMRSDWKERLWIFSLKNNFFCHFSIQLPKAVAAIPNIVSLCARMCLLQITLLCNSPVHKVWDFEWRCGRFPSSSNIILHGRAWSKMVLASSKVFSLQKTGVQMWLRYQGHIYWAFALVVHKYYMANTLSQTRGMKIIKTSFLSFLIVAAWHFKIGNWQYDICRSNFGPSTL